jgi:hypothetical protein
LAPIKKIHLKKTDSAKIYSKFKMIFFGIFNKHIFALREIKVIYEPTKRQKKKRRGTGKGKLKRAKLRKPILATEVGDHQDP